MAVNIMTVSDVLQRRNKLEEVGGTHHLLELTVNMPAVSAASTYSQIVRREATARRLDHAFAEARKSIADGNNPVEVADVAESALRSVDRGGQLPTQFWKSWDDYTADDHEGAGVPLIEGMCNQHTRIILLAAEKLGKSMLARQIAFCAAAGLHPFTFKPMPPVRVLVLDCENDDDELLPTSNRLLDCLKKNPDAGEGRPALFSAPYGMNLRSRRDKSELEQVLEDVRPQLIVGGPIYKMLPQADSTSDPRHAEELQRILDDLRKRWGCALMLEHHAPAGKAGQEREIRSVGGQRWAAWPEVTIALHNSRDPDPEGAEVRFPHPTRGRFRWPKRFDRARFDWDWPWNPILKNDDAMAYRREERQPF
jgi:replicative DNA helicase